jgi:UDP-3-O-[3-hydroxymyristoyl] glucosamine N-acyltransferase
MSTILTAAELANWLGGAVEGDAKFPVSGVASIESAGPGDLSFAAGKKASELAASTRAGCLLVAGDFASAPNGAQPVLVRVADPRAAFARCVSRFHPITPPPPGIHPTAVVSPDAVIGEGTSIGPHCTVGADVRIGSGCVLHPNVTIYAGSEIGNRVIFHSGAVIGADGFGFVVTGGRYEKFPQVGIVRIGDDVEIGANSCVDRAALGVTMIGEGTKLDNMVHVAHNCRIGRHVVIAAQTGLSGGVEIGDYAVVGGQVGVGDKARIQSKAIVGSGAGILTSKIVHAGEPVWGTPARPLREYLRTLAHQARLQKWKQLVDDLTRRVEKLERK